MEKAAASLKDETFYRSELASALMVDENAWYPINSVGLFGSTATDRMVNMMDNLGFIRGVMSIFIRCNTSNELPFECKIPVLSSGRFSDNRF